jgi:TonB-dependent receptor
MVTRKRIPLFFAVSLFLFQSAFAASSGTLKGKVYDADTKDALPGATILIKGTSIGAATDLNGSYVIPNAPAGECTIVVSYVGYASADFKANIEEGQTAEKDFYLTAVGVTAKNVVVTAQASGQNAAINQQLSSANVANVVSAARIQELPDANAAESVGRLPGISLIRNGGEATEVVIRGLSPQYNVITVDGVALPSTDNNNRSTDLSMISSNTLEGIEVYKTVTPDMDAAVLGGTVNFDIREAKGTASGAPLVSLLAQGAYDNLMSTYNDYKFVGSIEKRFSDDRFGIFAQGIVQRQNLTSDQFGGSYGIPDKTKPNSIVLDHLDLYLYPREEQRYDGTLSMDYKLPDGKIDLVNLFSHGNTNTQYHDETYDVGAYGNDIQYQAQYSPNTLNVITDILRVEQRVFAIKMDARLSHSYSENISPNNWWMAFDQGSAQTKNINPTENPVQIAQAAQALVNPSQLLFQNVSTWSDFSKQRDMAGSLDLERDFNLSDLMSVTLKAGGIYKYTTRYYNHDDGGGDLYGNFPTLQLIRSLIIKENPWMAQSPYNINPDGSIDFPINMFLDPNMSFGNFLNGDYFMNSAVNNGLVSSAALNHLIAFGDSLKTSATGGVNAYIPDPTGSLRYDYSGSEDRSAGYIMATMNIGSQVTIIPGVRYQGLRTSYNAYHFLTAASGNPYPNQYPHTDTNVTEYHGYWLPDVNLKYDPFLWLSVRASYSNTLSYPDFNTIIPMLFVDVSNKAIYWNNYALKPAQSHNYDVQVSVYDNNVGLFAVSPFLKRIDDFIFSQGTNITNPSLYAGIPSNTIGWAMNTDLNNPNPVNLWGIETEWQTHFWYLPNPFNGLVLNVNYTHIFSSAKYPYTITQTGGYPPKTTYIDTFYVDRLINQPNDVVNLSVGYDYGRFSILASMIYQSQVYNNTNFYNSLRSDKAKYVRWDLAVNQGLPWFGLEAFLNFNNLNSENDIYLVRGSGFPTSESDYGMTANLGLKWTLQ